jgi:hypothetical protein
MRVAFSPGIKNWANSENLFSQRNFSASSSDLNFPASALRTKRSLLASMRRSSPLIDSAEKTAANNGSGAWGLASDPEAFQVGSTEDTKLIGYGRAAGTEPLGDGVMPTRMAEFREWKTIDSNGES